MSNEQILAMRKQKDEHFAGAKSPLTEEQRSTFSGLNYFDINPDLRFTVELTPFDEPVTIPLPMNNDTDGPAVQKIGRFSVSIEGQEVTFTALKMGEQGMGFHFKDGTNGDETYPAGRFLPLLPEGENRFVADFNLAGNLMCAYTAGWTCPVPLPENCINVSIRAGEKIPVGDWVLT